MNQANLSWREPLPDFEVQSLDELAKKESSKVREHPPNDYLARLKDSRLGQALFFFKESVGKDGFPFYAIKLRSMCKNAESQDLNLFMEAQHTTNGDIMNDPRVIPLYGHIIRTTRLDELPQLINLLRGEMALVGPRPRQEHWWKNVYGHDMLELAINRKPGLVPDPYRFRPWMHSHEQHKAIEYATLTRSDCETTEYQHEFFTKGVAYGIGHYWLRLKQPRQVPFQKVLDYASGASSVPPEEL